MEVGEIGVYRVPKEQMKLYYFDFQISENSFHILTTYTAVFLTLIFFIPKTKNIFLSTKMYSISPSGGHQYDSQTHTVNQTIFKFN